jgi:hypothetical protein
MNCLGRDQRTVDSGQLGSFQDAALDPKPSQGGSHIGQRLGQESISFPKKAGNLVYSSQLTPNPAYVIGGTASQHPLGAERAGREGGHAGKHGVQFDGFDGVGSSSIRQRRRGAGDCVHRHPA